MAYTQVGIFVALSLQSTTKGVAIDKNDLWIIAMILSGGWATAMIVLLVFSERGYKHTFYQTTRAWEYSKALFDTRDDEYRMSIFDDHREYYRWYESHVKEWLAEVWGNLHHTKPVWFNDEIVKSISHELIPNIESIEQSGGQEIMREQRRKSSVTLIIG